MAQEASSFWTDIKKYEDLLAKDPNSYCFAPLSELYRKIGLLDDAIFVARRGIENHPDYVGGHLALGRAYFDKGQKDNSRVVLELVVRITPENYTAQKLLSQIYLEQNDTELAEKSLEAVLALNPDDVESRLSLEALTRSGGKIVAKEPFFEDDEELEEAEIVEDDLIDLGGGADESLPMSVLDGEPPCKVEPSKQTVATRDPLTTVTLAEIYFAQGFHDQALNIYRELSAAEPDNDELRRRIAEIEEIKEQPLDGQEPLDTGAPIIDPPLETMFNQSLLPDSSHEPRSGSHAVRTVATLENWLERIERRRACC